MTTKKLHSIVLGTCLRSSAVSLYAFFTIFCWSKLLLQLGYASENVKTDESHVVVNGLD
jgi:hypothetical protein